jgi:hypothetical protein
MGQDETAMKIWTAGVDPQPAQVPTKVHAIPELMKRAGWVRAERIMEERERCADICESLAGMCLNNDTKAALIAAAVMILKRD